MTRIICCLLSFLAVLCLPFGHGSVAAAATAGPLLSYATYLGGGGGGNNPDTAVNAVTVDSQGNVYLTGVTDGGFPTTAGTYQPQFIGGSCATAFDSTLRCPDVFVAKMSATGSLLWSTYVGGTGTDKATAIAVDAAGNVYVAGVTDSTDFPTTADALQKTGPPVAGSVSGFLIKLDSAGAHVLYGTYVGGAGDAPNALAIGPAGDLYVAGYAVSGAFPVRNALQPNPGGGDCSAFQHVACGDAFVMHWNAPAMTLLASTLLGGSGEDSAAAVTLDAAGNVYLTGGTSSVDFPLRNAFQTTIGNGVCQSPAGQVSTRCQDAFVTKLSGDLGSISYSTRLGGDAADAGTAIAVDGPGYIVVAGTTQSANFPTTNAAQLRLAKGTCTNINGTTVPCSAGFVARLAPDGASLAYSTFLGGGANDTVYALTLDASGTAYVAGGTESKDFPTTQAAIQHCNAMGAGIAGGTGFLTAITSSGQIAWSTYLGGSTWDNVWAAAAGQGKLFLGGVAASPDFPVTAGAIQAKFAEGNGIGFLAILDLTRGYSTPYVEPACVVNAASYQGGPVAAGEIVTIFGQALGPVGGAGAALDSQGRIAKSLAGVSATFDGAPAPLLYAGPNQVNTIVPFGLVGKTSTQLVVSYQGVASHATTLGVSTAAPGVFAYAGGVLALAYNQDGTLNTASNPAARGSVVAVWMTGAGALNQTYADGQIVSGAAGSFATLLGSPKVGFGGLGDAVPQGQVMYAGQAPGLVAGAVQLNFTVPLNAPVGPAVAVYVAIPGITVDRNGPAVTLALK